MQNIFVNLIEGKNDLVLLDFVFAAINLDLKYVQLGNVLFFCIYACPSVVTAAFAIF